LVLWRCKDKTFLGKFVLSFLEDGAYFCEIVVEVLDEGAILFGGG
jgi:hypothetical protein